MASTHHGRDVKLRIASASIGAVLTSLIISPLEVVKVRLQSQAAHAVPDVNSARNALECSACKDILFDTGLMEHRVPKTRLLCPDHLPPHRPVVFKGTVDALAWIVRQEGVGSLFNGIYATLWMSIPATVIYFASYEEIRDGLNLVWPEMRDSNPLFAGAFARIIGATAVAPLELVRTQAQAQTRPPKMRTMIAEIFTTHGIWGFWRGLSPTLWRDVPFSAIYWVLVERMRRESRLDSVLLTNAISGALAGVVAAIATHPFDVIKTRRQVFDLADRQLPNEMKSTFGMMRNIGLSGLFVGLVPRMVKIAPSTAIMLSSYEVGKQFFHDV